MTADASAIDHTVHERGGALHALRDLTSVPRFGLKGPGTSDWLIKRGYALPDVNRSALLPDGLRILRLGREDVLLLGETAPKALSAFIESWEGFGGPKGYRSWREEGWAWMRLSAPALCELMASLCAVDLRPGHVTPDAVVQSRLARLEAVIVPSESAIDLFFDAASKAYVERAVAVAALGLDPPNAALSESGA